MGFGGSIFLIALGAIFAFAVEADLGWLNLAVVGWVLMLAGVAGLLLTLHFWNSRRRAVVAPVRGERVVAEQVVPVRDDRVVEEYREVRQPRRTV
ncbi:DUF6458 family protein [Micromonospora sp. DSM 115977]|jgi:hypothetical protein|uniref:DUF6458 family protein n=1 Tax=Micromonospora reichwaldensis TaxID=3075516 RepID=A0ABU2WQ36_9ACTN|nr:MULTISPECIES: DUF6458 family protein [unclassified Micromonospora]KAB1138109.1 hypothetical protein F6X68_26215 [Micromonospora sp. AMSO12t]MDT0527693.1 DUF6458 family protein [Micromonospora sp. DSM 115977]WSG03575.1 DUF6458 family protein [Micromonospora sp. NBC_01740]